MAPEIDEKQGLVTEERGELDADGGEQDERFDCETYQPDDEVDRTDLLKLYLREASRAPIFDAAGEIAAGKRIERARNRLIKLLSRSPLVAEYCAFLRVAFAAGDETPADLIEQIGNRAVARGVATDAKMLDRAFARIEETYREYRRRCQQNSRTRGRKESSRKARALVELSRAIRGIVFTPAAERRLLSLMETRNGVVELAGKPNDSIEPNSETSFDAGAIGRELARAGLLSQKSAARQYARASEAARILDQSKQKLTEANLRLVVSVARKFVGRGLPFLDLIQEGNMGLMRAAEKFEWRRGFRFSTYAMWWIRQSMARALDTQSRIVRLPSTELDLIGRISRARRSLCEENAHEPSSSDIADRLSIPEEDVDQAIALSQHSVALDAIVNDNGETGINFIDDGDLANPFTAAFDRSRRDALRRAPAHLSPREARILRMHYGLDTQSEPRTLEEIGQDLSVTRERVRQIEAHALAKLRDLEAEQSLRDYLVTG